MVVKCEVPSFVADFVSVIGWVDSDNNNYDPTSEYGKCTTIVLIKTSVTVSLSILFNQFRVFFNAKINPLISAVFASCSPVLPDSSY